MSEEHNKRLREAIRRYFRELKPEEADQIASELIMRGSMPALLNALGMPSPGDSGEQYAALLGFVRRNGYSGFLEAIERANAAAGKRRSSSSSQGVARPSAGAPPSGISIPKAAKPLVVRSTPLEAPKGADDSAPVRPPGPEHAGQRSEPPPLRALGKTENKKEIAYGLGFQFQRQSRTSAEAIKKQESRAAPPAKTGPTPGKSAPWNGVERRSGYERRSGIDRRESVELIFKNRRWGKDRRSGKERRSNWVATKERPPIS